MPLSPFTPWHDFYTLIGTAAATLVGLMFVAASVGTGVFTAERQLGLRTFLSPTVVAFSAVLAISLIIMLPLPGPHVPSILMLGIGALGILYSARVWQRMAQGGIFNSIDLEDRIWYTLVPAFAYLIVGIAGTLLGFRPNAACQVLATGIALLLLAGLRNAWDMTTWTVLRKR